MGTRDICEKEQLGHCAKYLLSTVNDDRITFLGRTIPLTDHNLTFLQKSGQNKLNSGTTGPVNMLKSLKSISIFGVCDFCSSVPVSHYCSLKNTLPQDSDFLATACHQTFGTSSTPLPPSSSFPSFSSPVKNGCSACMLSSAMPRWQSGALPGPARASINSPLVQLHPSVTGALGVGGRHH